MPTWLGGEVHAQKERVEKKPEADCVSVSRNFIAQIYSIYTFVAQGRPGTEFTSSLAADSASSFHPLLSLWNFYARSSFLYAMLSENIPSASFDAITF